MLSQLSAGKTGTLDKVEQKSNKDVNQPLSIDEILPQLKHRSVRDLAWVIGSPSILSQDMGSDFPGDDFFQRMLNLSLTTLSELDANPKPLEDYLQQAKTKRLGEKFERYWQYWLNACEGWKIIAADHQMSNKERTLGAFDLLLEEPDKKGLSHWELAVKFYLNTDHGSRMSEWYGPNQQDRLDKKLNRMLEHQLKLGEYPTVKKQLKNNEWEIKRTRGIVKGRLFWKSGPNQRQLPSWANSQADYGFWCTATQFDFVQKQDLLQWYLLDKSYWLSPLVAKDTEKLTVMDEDELRKIPESINEAVQVVGCDRITQIEVKRGFIVPDDWILTLNNW